MDGGSQPRRSAGLTRWSWPGNRTTEIISRRCQHSAPMSPPADHDLLKRRPPTSRTIGTPTTTGSLKRPPEHAFAARHAGDHVLTRRAHSGSGNPCGRRHPQPSPTVRECRVRRSQRPNRTVCICRRVPGWPRLPGTLGVARKLVNRGGASRCQDPPVEAVGVLISMLGNAS
jgi:hypothetical protein